MLNKELENSFDEMSREDGFIYPSYQGCCLSNIPSTILELLSIQTPKPTLPTELYKDRLESGDCDKIVLLLLDGYGHDQWLKYCKGYEFFDAISRKGVLSPITTVFPSTTATALTTMNTGLTPQEHALLEWVVYFKEIDMIINTLPFTPLGKKGHDRLIEMGVSPRILYRGSTVHQTLKKEGIKSFTFINASYADSCYSKIVHKGSTITPFIAYSDLVVRLRKFIQEEKGPAYFYAYMDSLDAMEHEYGRDTDECLTELSVLSYLLKREFVGKIDRKAAKETLLLMTSDHGQVNISPEKTIYLNKFRKLANAFRISEKGKPVLPTGEARDVFLHLQPDRLEETQHFLSSRLEASAKVMRTDEVTRMGLFGTGKPRTQFHDRAGDLLILPYSNHTVWYEYIKGKKLDLLAHHGGLSRDEMLVPFAAARLSELL